MASELDLELEALFARIESPESYEAVEALFAGTADVACRYEPEGIERLQQERAFDLVT